ncbi:thioredoxin family protein [Archaeoglobus veneficus]|uniref:Thioredoxin domain-containing protein n=1 Tax=Archaeoglobus veneficus (strain DSM 11195 / SNP6) TaxID=693661 RepID=F2KNN5_ARCVS|nr:thioredoxin family protein [Archaeoglobus veneficus]AEA46263.1 Thioredoxin domain-containing protein [Archaeoglobus veneficus SNP6]
MIELNEQSLREFVREKFAVVEFYNDFCPYCRMLTAILSSICREMGIKVGKINVGNYPDIGREYEIELVPTVIVFSRGEAVGGFMGFTTRNVVKAELERLVREYC